MTLLSENGRAQWMENTNHLRILYSMTKVYMEEHNLDNIPIGSRDHCEEIAERFSLAIGEDVTGGQVSGALYMQFDNKEFPNNISNSHLIRFRIALEVGLIDVPIFKNLF